MTTPFTVAEIRRQHHGHWFDPETMRFFHTRICAGGRMFGGRYFVTSERNPSGVRPQGSFRALSFHLEAVQGNGVVNRAN